MRGGATTPTVAGFITPTLATDRFTQCFGDVQCPPSGGADVRGNPASVSGAVGVSRDLRKRACGPEQKAFNLISFCQKFTSFLLPWLALISVLPFGASDGVDNFLDILLTIGSPTLAAYSLLLTVLNRRWLAKRIDLEIATHRHANNVFHDHRGRSATIPPANHE
jgi:hypothetical protein